MKRPPHILQAIQYNLEQKESVLDLHGQALLEVPAEIKALKHLKQLLLKNNAIQTLPEWLNDLPQLEFIQLNINPLHEVGKVRHLVLDWGVWWRLQPDPQQVSGLWLRWEEGEMLEAALALPHLQWLDLSEQRLREVPKRVFELEGLRVLNLSVNSLRQLSPDIQALKSLSLLDLSWNKLSVLPAEMRQLQKEALHIHTQGNHFEPPPHITPLQKSILPHHAENPFHQSPFFNQKRDSAAQLSLSHHKLTERSLDKEQLQSLTFLSLANNQLKELPDWIGDLSHLSRLSIDNNYIRQLPATLAQLHDLRSLRVKYHWQYETNFLESPPLEALDLDENGYADITKLRAYFRQAAEAELDYLYEAKLLIVGEGGAGKTSLMRRLMNEYAALPEPEASTRGIDIVRWEFPLTQAIATTEPQKKTFRVNIWDFGGQQIYHATHQFFLTKRSLYALVADTREERTNFYDWLNRVELFSDNSPVFIVKNQKDERAVKLDEPSLKERFHRSLKAVFDCNLSDNRGRAEMLAFLQYQIQQLPHVGQALPKTWLKVREQLEQVGKIRPYIAQQEYVAMCLQAGFKRREDALQLSGYLHDLGVCLHFQDDDVLAKTVILNPTWGTDAVYKVLDSPCAQGGRFSRADLQTMWSEDEYADMRPELLRLMTAFQLCYELPEAGHYIVPQLLDEAKPQYDWDAQHNLQLRYSYPRFMPKGILTRFMVAVHPLIEAGRERVWQYGVVLCEDDTRAEVREDVERREIRLRLSGRHKRDLLAYLVGKLEEIHRTLHGLEYQQWIPCHCTECVRSQEPHFYPYQVLKRFRDDGQPSIQCQLSYALVDVRGLLDDTLGEQGWRPRPPSEREALLQALSALLPTQFDAVFFRFGMPLAYQRGGASQAQQSMDLVAYAEQQAEGLQRLRALIDLPGFKRRSEKQRD